MSAITQMHLYLFGSIRTVLGKLVMLSCTNTEIGKEDLKGRSAMQADNNM
jgi:hypothetical protein